MKFVLYVYKKMPEYIIFVKIDIKKVCVGNVFNNYKMINVLYVENNYSDIILIYKFFYINSFNKFF